jgi:hypothetical protein
MVIINRLKNFIEELDERNFYHYLGGFLAVVVVLMLGIVYLQYSNVTALKKKIARLNRNRDSAQTILIKFEHVKQQKAEVAAILEKDKTFKIVGALNTILNELGLQPNKASHTTVTQNLESLPEYNEVRLTVNLVNLNTKQLTELLQEIEKNERMYSKDLEITKNIKPTIDVTLTVATLLLRTQLNGEEQ